MRVPSPIADHEPSGLRNAPLEQRKFLVSDGVVLVFAMAVGFAWTRSLYGHERFDYSSASLRDAAYAAFTVVWVACPTVSTLSLAVLALRMRSPKPRWRRIVRQPGFAACFFASAAALLAGVGELLLSTGILELHPHNGRDEVIGPFWIGAGSTTLGAWAIMRLGGGWRAERNWVDRSGRMLGFFWIGLFFAMAAAWFLNCLG